MVAELVITCKNKKVQYSLFGLLFQFKTKLSFLFYSMRINVLLPEV